ncbi:unnamed protein product, partial [Rotaria sp. Silwood1]
STVGKPAILQTTNIISQENSSPSFPRITSDLNTIIPPTQQDMSS